MRRWLVKIGSVLVVLGGLLVAVGQTSAAPTTSPNPYGYIHNGGFEGGFYSVGAGQVAESWTRVNLRGSNPNWMSTCIFVNAGPNCDQGWVEKIELRNSHILSVEHLGIGEPFETVLLQQVPGLTAGQSYSFSGWVLKLWGGSGNFDPPTDPYSYGSWLGVDPTGGTNPDAASVIWGDYNWEQSYGNDASWRNQRMAFVATQPTATVFARLWLKWQEPETQAIVDSLELFDAPTVTLLHDSSEPLTSPLLEWSGTLPAMLQQRGSFQLFYDVQKLVGGEWVTIAEDLTGNSFEVPLAPNETAQVRVLPVSYQLPSGLQWPPTTHVGLPSPTVTIVLDAVAPVATLARPPRWLDAVPVPLSWSGTDAGSGVASFDVEYRAVGAAAWVPWLSATTQTSAAFGGGSPVVLAAGQEWEFHVRARDAAGNVGAWSPAARVGLVAGWIRGTLLAANDEPMPGAHIEIAPNPYSALPPVGVYGEYLLPVADLSQGYTLTFRDAAGNTRLPVTTVHVGALGPRYDWHLPPLENAVANGNFEQVGGWSGAWSQGDGHSGAHGATLAAGAAISQSLQVASGDGLSLLLRAVGEGASLHVQLGSQSWHITPDEAGPNEESWTHWFQTVSGDGSKTLTLTAIGGALQLDEASLGEPQRAATLVYLPLAAR